MSDTDARARSPVPRVLLLLMASLPALTVSPGAAGRVEVLRSTGGLPAHIAGVFTEPTEFQRVASGEYLVFDRRAHSVYSIDAAATAAKKIVQMGPEEGRIIGSSAFDLGPNRTFVIADAPNRRERVQRFSLSGTRLGGFTLPGRATPRLTLGGTVLNGIGSLQYTGRSLLMSQPETGTLITEFALSGGALRSFGTFRPTGHEHDRDVHLALNSGLPLVNPKGGFYFVFQAGTPIFRKYDQSGRLLFERHIEGPELDEVIRSLPTAWPRRRTDGGSELPLILPTVRTAAVDPDGNLWVALTVPYTYVYDPDGEKLRTVQFRGAGILTPTSLFFASPSVLLVTPGCYEFTVR